MWVRERLERISTEMSKPLSYETLERLRVGRPVDRLDFLAELCRDKVVLDIGCLDETALSKRDTKYWLHGRISTVAREVIGIDSSSSIPPEGLRTANNAIILHGDGVDLDLPEEREDDVDQIVAGEFIEHVEAPLEFLRNMKRRFPGKELLITTPNGSAFANSFLGIFGREAQHPDHLQIFTYKILTTLCMRAGIERWEIIPYRFTASEMILNSKGPKRLLTIAVQGLIRGVERFLPLLSFGYVVRMRM